MNRYETLWDPGIGFVVVLTTNWAWNTSSATKFSRAAAAATPEAYSLPPVSLSCIKVSTIVHLLKFGYVFHFGPKGRPAPFVGTAKCLFGTIS